MTLKNDFCLHNNNFSADLRINFIAPQFYTSAIYAANWIILLMMIFDLIGLKIFSNYLYIITTWWWNFMKFQVTSISEKYTIFTIKSQKNQEFTWWVIRYSYFENIFLLYNLISSLKTRSRHVQRKIKPYFKHTSQQRFLIIAKEQIEKEKHQFLPCWSRLKGIVWIEEFNFHDDARQNKVIK